MIGSRKINKEAVPEVHVGGNKVLAEGIEKRIEMR